MLSQNYVGISGITNIDNVKKVSNEFIKRGFNSDSSHIGAINFQTSYVSMLYGESKGNYRVPHINNLNQLVNATKNNCFIGIHFYTTKNVDETSKKLMDKRGLNTYSEQIKYIMNQVDFSNIDNYGIQFNMNFPELEELKIIKENHPLIKVIFQLRYKKNKTYQEQLTELSYNYGNLVDLILIDNSLGTGKNMNVNESIENYFRIKNNFKNINVAFAGGINNLNVQEIITQIKTQIKTNNFSIDAERGLRKRLGPGYGNDEFILHKAIEYIKNSKLSLQSYNIN